MIKSILVCLEGSPSTGRAVRTSIAIARERDAALVGIAIIDEPDIRSGSAMGIGGSSFKHERDEALLHDAHAKAREWLARFEDACRESGVAARTLETVGRPAENIIAEMERHEVTVIGRDANFRFETETADASTRDSILRHATRPILLVPESTEDAADGLGHVVLVAYDGSGAASRAMASFAESGLAQSREIHVATVDDSGERAGDMALRAAESLRASGITATSHGVVSAATNAEALAKLATDLGAGLVVMGAFARSRLAELFSGSVTRKVVEHSPTPVFLQH